MAEQLRFRVVLDPDFDADAFGGYLAGSAPEGTATIGIAFEAIFDACAREEALDWRAVTAEVVVHEMLHAVQELLGQAFSEVDVDAAIEAARAAYAGTTSPPPAVGSVWRRGDEWRRVDHILPASGQTTWVVWRNFARFDHHASLGDWLAWAEGATEVSGDA